MTGRRVWESMNAKFRTYPLEHTTTDIYLPQQVAVDFRERLRWGGAFRVDVASRCDARDRDDRR
ncbi:MAG: hypothetical protein K8S97_01025 [Anaerolineae bacterium]|nr:hypothetical protein [Anaerolineae bacterium]